ncbi:MAG: CBS domain-containing protein [Acidimicrobiia bacterium]|nr:CBS domain-containing protein [Acidimicrobiia bacterium]MDH4308539.1 CBS domain-containing protein [Acidimicrobiia bacterium]MDH5294661.1 CBS domain-containing protein [Acidimicrobiia bacterium]
MTLGDLVMGTAHVCGPATTLSEATDAMTVSGHGSMGVVEGGDLVGILTERDVVRAMSRGASGADPISRWMSGEPDAFGPDVDVFEAAEWLLASGYRHLPVVDDGRLLGIVGVTEVLRAVLESTLDETDS